MMKSAIKTVALAAALVAPAVSFAQSSVQSHNAPPPPAQKQAQSTSTKEGSRLFKVGPHYPDDVVAAEDRDTPEK